MIVWGVISAATAAVNSYSGLLVVRFFLGFVEAAYFVRHLSPPIPQDYAKLASSCASAGLLTYNATPSPDACTTCPAGTPVTS
jgi:hypothetical protein